MSTLINSDVGVFISMFEFERIAVGWALSFIVCLVSEVSSLVE